VFGPKGRHGMGDLWKSLDTWISELKASFSVRPPGQTRADNEFVMTDALRHDAMLQNLAKSRRLTIPNTVLEDRSLIILER
jgi:hypothetical protein